MKSKINTMRNAFPAFISLAFVYSSPLRAQNGTWSGDATGGTWDVSSTNWTGVTGNSWDATLGLGNTATFNTSSLALTVSGTVTAGGVIFSQPASLTGGTIALGSSGINASALSSGTVSIASGVSLNSRQTWNIGSGATLALSTGAFTRSAGASLNISGGGTVSSSLTGLANDGSSGGGMLGAWATTGSGASTRFATLSGGNVVSYTGATASANFGWTSTNPATNNYDVAATAGSTLGVSRTGNTVRYTGGAETVTWGNSATNTTLTLNGLLNAGSGTLTIARGGTATGTGLVVGSTGTLVLNASSADITISAPIFNNASASALVKDGTGIVTLSGSGNLSGNLFVNAGTLRAALGRNVLDPTTSSLGNPMVARNIVVNNGGTLQFTAGDALGSATTTPVATLVINAGGTVNNSGTVFTSLGPVVLNGGTLTTLGGAAAGFQSFNLMGSVTVGGISASTISVTGAGNANNGFHLQTNTTFNVADVTSSAASDLTVSAPLINRNQTLGGNGGFTKSGAGTMTLTAANTFSGNAAVSAGTLVLGVNGGNPQFGTLENAALLTIEAGAAVRVWGANAFKGWSGGTQAVTINGGDLILSDGVTENGNHALAALVLNGGTISGVGNAVFGGFNLLGGVSVTNDSTISATNTNTVNTTCVVTVAESKTLQWTGSIINGNNNAWTTALTFAGAGTTVLSGNNTHSGVTTINGGTLRVGNGSTTGSLGSGAVVNNAALVFHRSDDISIAQSISGTGSLEKTGAGALTIANAMAYSGATTLSQGKLILEPTSGSLTGTSALSLAAGTTLSLTSTAANRLQTVPSLTMDGATVELAILGNNVDQIAVTTAASFSGTNTIKLNGNAAPGTYTLISTPAALSGNFTLDTSGVTPGFTTLSGAVVGNDYVLTVTGSPLPGTAYWTGDISNSWSDASLAPNNSNWATDAAGTIDALQIPSVGTDVVFASASSTNSTSALSTNMSVDSVTFESGNFSISGVNSLTLVSTNANGHALEVKANASASLSMGASAWTGNTHVEANGTLVVGATTALGNADAPLSVNGTLTLNANVSKGELTGSGLINANTAATIQIGSTLGSSYSGTFDNGTAALSLTKTGTGLLTLLGNSSHTGVTTVSAGQLEIGNGGTTGALGSGSITVNAGGILSWNRSDDITIANSINGAFANVVQNGSGALTLSGNNNFATGGGSGLLVNNGSVVLGAASAVPANVVLGVRNGLLDLNGYNITAGWLDGTNTGVVTDRSGTAGTTTLTLNVTSNPICAAAINDGTNGRILALVKTAAGTQTLSGSSNFSGGTELRGGLLQVNSDTALGTSTVLVPGNNVDITRLQFGPNVTFANNIELGTPTRTNFNGAISIPGANDAVTLTGTILIKASGLVGGTVNGGSFFGPTGTGLLTLAGAVNTDSAGTVALVRGGNVRLVTAGNATNWRNEGALSLGAAGALNSSSSVAIAGSNAASFDLNGFPQTLVGIGSSLAHNFAATITNTSATAATLTLDTSNSTDYATAVTGLSIGSLGVNVLDANTVIAGNLSLIKQGAGTLQLQGPSTFTGNVTISSGTVIADRGNNVNNPTNSCLGNPLISRTITVEPGATLRLQQGDTLGSATTVPIATLVVNAGATVINNGNNFNTFGPVRLNGGTITTSGGAIAGYQSYNLLGTVTVGGSAPSSITVNGAGNAFNGYHLDTSTTFDVADATADSAADLVVTAPLIDRNATLTGAGGLNKSGAGTMSIQTAATYTGDTQVQEGVLSLAQSHLADGADVRMIGSGKLHLGFAGTDTVRALYIDDQLQYTGVWGAIGSGAQYETASITGTGTLTVTSGATPPGYTSWAQNNGLTAGVNDGLSADPDLDGLVNLLEYTLGGNPLSSSQSSAPVAGPSGANLLLTFKRLDLSETDTTTTIQYSTDLVTWTDFVTVGAESAGAVTIVENGAGLDDVTVAIPLSNAVNGKLFTRVKAAK